MDVVTHFGLSQDPFATPEPGSLAGDTLTPEAARAYLAGRIAGAGRPDLFTPSALDVLAEAAGGDPDLLRRLGGSALFHAAFEGAQQVEDQHARQAVTMPDRSVSMSPALAAATVAPVHSLRGNALAADAAAPDPIFVHRRWWRRTPPMTRLAIVVGALLLSLPVVGYTIGVVKDTQAANESSYLPANSINDQEKIAPAVTAGGGVVTTDMAAAAILPAPADLRLPTTMPRREPRAAPEAIAELPVETAPAAEPDVVAASGLVVSEIAPPPAPEIETVPIDPPAEPVAEEETPQR